MLALGLVVWELAVRISGIPPYVLPAPGLILQTLAADWGLLARSLLVTLITTFEGFLLAAAGGVGLAVLFNQSRLVEYSLYPYAVILQVTPIVAVAPLLLIYLPQQAAVLACAWIVAFFPVLANTTLGLHSVDRNLTDLFSLYGASRGQMLWRLKLPSALPYILGGLRIAGGLSLIGAVVAEIAAGSAGAGSGLAYRIAESGYRLNIPRMFAALLLLSVAGIVIFYLFTLINYLALRHWHESALRAESERRVPARAELASKLSDFVGGSLPRIGQEHLTRMAIRGSKPHAAGPSDGRGRDSTSEGVSTMPAKRLAPAWAPFFADSRADARSRSRGARHRHAADRSARPRIRQVAKRVLKGIKTIFKTTQPVIIYTATGTGAWEAALVNMLSPATTC